MANFTKFNAFVADGANKKHNLGSDTLKVALFPSTTAPTANDATYDDTTTFTLNSSGATELPATSGYTHGGVAVGTVTSTQSGGTYKLIPTNPNLVFTASGGTISNIQYAVLYNQTAGSAGARPVIGFWNYGVTTTLNSGDSITVQLDGTNGILQLA